MLLIQPRIADRGAPVVVGGIVPGRRAGPADPAHPWLVDLRREALCSRRAIRLIEVFVPDLAPELLTLLRVQFDLLRLRPGVDLRVLELRPVAGRLGVHLAVEPVVRVETAGEPA